MPDLRAACSVSRRAWKASPSGSAHRRGGRTSSARARWPRNRPVRSAVARPGRRARWHARPRRHRGLASAGRARSASPSCASRLCDRSAANVSTTSTLHAGNARGQPRDQQAHHPATDHRDAVADARCGVPQRIDRRLHVGGQHRARGRQAIGQCRCTASGRHHVARLGAGTGRTRPGPCRPGGPCFDDARRWHSRTSPARESRRPGKGARMRCVFALGHARRPSTSSSVPRLTALCRARTRTSPSLGPARACFAAGSRRGPAPRSSRRGSHRTPQGDELLACSFSLPRRRRPDAGPHGDDDQAMTDLSEDDAQPHRPTATAPHRRARHPRCACRAAA
jgi:hypothetical protein